MRWVLLAGLLLLLPVIPVTASDDLPPGAAAIVVFHEGNRPPRRLVSLNLHGDAPAHGGRPYLFSAPVWDASQGPKRIIVMAGSYSVHATRRVALAYAADALSPLKLSAGETVYMQLDASRQAPWVAQVDAGVFANYMARGGRPALSDEEQYFRAQHSSVFEWHLGAQEIDPPGDRSADRWPL